jgi:hypothetical protein
MDKMFLDVLNRADPVHASWETLDKKAVKNVNISVLPNSEM